MVKRRSGSWSAAADCLRLPCACCRRGSWPLRSVDGGIGLLSAEELPADSSLPRSCCDSSEVRPELPRAPAADPGDARSRAKAEVSSPAPPDSGACRCHDRGTGTGPGGRASAGISEPGSGLLDGEWLLRRETRIIPSLLPAVWTTRESSEAAASAASGSRSAAPADNRRQEGIPVGDYPLGPSLQRRNGTSHTRLARR